MTRIFRCHQKKHGYSTTIYIDMENEKEILLSGGVEDQTGGTIDIPESPGKISGDIFRDSDADKLADSLFYVAVL